MSTWKKLNQQDVSISTYNAQKEWSVSSIEMVDYGIRVYAAYSGSIVPPTPTPTPTPTSTPNPTSTPTATPNPTATPTSTPEPTNTPAPTDTPVPTDTPTPEPTATPVPTDTPTPEPTSTPSPTSTPEPTVAPTNTPEPTVTPTNTPEPTVTPTNTPEPTVTPTSTPEPTATPTSTPTHTPSPSSTPTPTPTATPVPLYGFTACDGGTTVFQNLSAEPNSGDRYVDYSGQDPAYYVYNGQGVVYGLTPVTSNLQPTQNTGCPETATATPTPEPQYATAEVRACTGGPTLYYTFSNYSSLPDVTPNAAVEIGGVCYEILTANYTGPLNDGTVTGGTIHPSGCSSCATPTATPTNTPQPTATPAPAQSFIAIYSNNMSGGDLEVCAGTGTTLTVYSNCSTIDGTGSCRLYDNAAMGINYAPAGYYYDANTNNVYYIEQTTGVVESVTQCAIAPTPQPTATPVPCTSFTRSATGSSDPSAACSLTADALAGFQGAGTIPTVGDTVYGKNCANVFNGGSLWYNVGYGNLVKINSSGLVIDEVGC